MSRKPDDYTWFAEPKNQVTNLILANILAAENFCPNKKVDDGILRNLWQMDRFDQVTYLTSNPDTKVNLYVRQGLFGKIRQVNFMLKEKANEDTRKKLEDLFKQLDLNVPKLKKPKLAF